MATTDTTTLAPAADIDRQAARRRTFAISSHPDMGFREPGIDRHADGAGE